MGSELEDALDLLHEGDEAAAFLVHQVHAMHEVVRVEEMGCDVVDVLAVCLQQPLYHHQLGLTREDAVQLQAVSVRQRVFELLELLGQLLVQLIDDL